MRRIAALVALSLVVAGCTAPLATERARGGGAAKPPVTTVVPGTTTLPPADTTTTTTTLPLITGPLSLPDQVSLTLIDLTEFWAEELPDVFGMAYEPVTVLGGYDVDVDGPPPCGDEVLEPAIARGNAFYCPVDDSVAWDEVELFPTLYDDFGPFAVSLVLAHEWGHAVQSRVLESGLPTVVSELQADCYAGAWTGHAIDQGLVDVGASELDVATAGFLYFRDPVSGSATDAGAHGNAFDRVGAFTDGIRAGVEACAGYADDFPPITQIGFRSAEDAASGGNLPKADVFPQLAKTLDVWWATLLGASGVTWDAFSQAVTLDAAGESPCTVIDPASLGSGFGYCQGEDALVLDFDGVLDPLYDAFGDFGPAFVMGNAWAEKGQSLLGLETSGLDADLQADCLTGAWAGDGRTGLPNGELRPDGEPDAISLSPGDLDEAIQSILYLGEGAEDGPTAFERVESFRTGVLGGADACLAP